MPKERIFSIPCKVGEGVFSFERTIAVDLPDGSTAYAIVHKSLVRGIQDLAPDTVVDGRVEVSLVDLKKDSAVVDLPGEGIRNGTRLIIPKKLVQAERK